MDGEERQPGATMDEDERAFIRSRAARLPRRSPFRRMAQDLLDGRMPLRQDTTAAWQALEKPDGARWRERSIACWVVWHGEMDDRTPVVRLLMDTLERCRKEGYLSRLGRAIRRTCLYASLPLASFLTIVCLFDPTESFEAHLIFLYGFLMITCALLPVAIPLSMLGDWNNNQNVRMSAALVLGRLGATEALGALARAFCERDGAMQATAREALREILPALAPEHYGTLGPDTMRSLCRALRVAAREALYNEPLALDLLAALEKVGGGTAVPTVDHLARYDSGRVRGEAARMLPVLQERQRQENAPHRLLRPADAPADPAAMLLRPAVSTPEAEESLLLRPAGGTEEGTNR